MSTPIGATAHVFWSPCPECSHMLEFAAGGPTMRCTNTDCTWTGPKPDELAVEKRNYRFRPTAAPDGGYLRRAVRTTGTEALVSALAALPDKEPE